MENILNNKFINLDEVSTKYHQQYLNNKLFPYMVLSKQLRKLLTKIKWIKI